MDCTSSFVRLDSYHWKLIILLLLVWLLNSTFNMLTPILIPLIVKELSLSFATIGLIFSFNRLGGSIGPYFIGTVADYLGRKRTLLVLVPLSALCFFIVGFSEDWVQLSISLALYSFVSSGFFPVIFTFASEELPPQNRGFGISAIASGYALGGGVLASLIAAKLGLLSWRTPFFFGVIPALMTLIGVSNLSESRIWRSYRDKKERVRQSWVERVADFKPFLIWRRKYLRNILSALFVRVLASILWAGVARWVTAFLVLELGMSATVGTMWFTFFGMSGFFGNLFNGWCADRYGRKMTISLFFLSVGIFIMILAMFIRTEFQAYLVSVPVGFTLLGLYPTTFAFTTEVLPSEARASGMASITVLNTPLSIALPVLIGIVSTAYSISLCFEIIAFTVIILGTLLFFIIPETKGKIL